MRKYQIDIRVERGLKCPFKRDWVRGIIKTILNVESVKYHLELGIMFTDNPTIQKLNKKYRSINQPTDVLSFSLPNDISSIFQLPSSSSPECRTQIGEIVISLPMAFEQASDHKSSIEREVTVLLIHGTLHLLGYDHIKASDARRMEAKEKTIINSIDLNEG